MCVFKVIQGLSLNLVSHGKARMQLFLHLGRADLGLKVSSVTY